MEVPAAVSRLLRPLPELHGDALRLEWRSGLRVYRGRLHEGEGAGQPVHAASYPRSRRLVVDEELRSNGPELARIVAHELFHFVWVRLGNQERHEWEALVLSEIEAGARGELGWSAEWRKSRLSPADRERRSRRWREYLCESFCDTAAWNYSFLTEHEEFTLKERFRRRRRAWIAALERHHRGGFRV